jgi:hypothetical protein
VESHDQRRHAGDSTADVGDVVQGKEQKRPEHPVVEAESVHDDRGRHRHPHARRRFHHHELFHRFRDAVADGDQPRASLSGKRPAQTALELAAAEKQEDEITEHGDDQLGHVEAVREDVLQDVLRRDSEEVGE